MKTKLFIILTTVPTFFIISWFAPDVNWLTEKYKGYTLMYTPGDKMHISEYNTLIGNGITSVNAFFSSTYDKEFNIYVHPDRHSLDSSWQREWNMPEFKSECWMVASGTATRLDIISPKNWDKEACEHFYSETKKTQRLITHELVHVYHGQKNISPDFSNTEGIDWFVEGLATYVSGQCDSLRISEVKKAINENMIPANLENFWTGKIKYGLSGSVVMYIDNIYGRAKLIEILPLSKKQEIFSALKTSEPEFLNGWKKYIMGL